MSQTYPATAIVLKRRAFKEDDASVVLYTKEKGKIDLVVRGAKKICSRLIAHLEPMTLVRVMVVRGRQYDYAGSASSENCFSGIKSDLAKLKAAGRFLRLFDRLVKERVPDSVVFDILQDGLESIAAAGSTAESACDPSDISILRLLSALGFRPELKVCARCRGQISPLGNAYDPTVGGLVCPACWKEKASSAVSADAIKALRFITNFDASACAKLRVGNRVRSEVRDLISLMAEYAA